MRSWWKVSKCGWANRRQASLTQVYKNLFPTWQVPNFGDDYVEN
jgi:hypothetical protein